MVSMETMRTFVMINDITSSLSGYSQRVPHNSPIPKVPYMRFPKCFLVLHVFALQPGHKVSITHLGRDSGETVAPVFYILP